MTGLFGLPKPRVADPLLTGYPSRSPVRHVGERGATLTTSVSLNTKNTWTTVVAATSEECDGFYLVITGGSVVGSWLVDIGIGGSNGVVERVLIENLLMGHATTSNISDEVYIPLPLPRGTRIAARFQSTDASQPIAVDVHLVRGDFYRSLRCGGSQTLGANTADSGGTEVDPGAVANTKGAWTRMGVFDFRIRCLLICLGGRDVVHAEAENVHDLAYGESAGSSVFVENLYARSTSVLDVFVPALHSRPVDIPAGQPVWMRAASADTNATSRLIDAVLIGFYSNRGS